MGRRTITYTEYWAKNTNERKLAEVLTEMAGQDDILAFYLSPDACAKRSDAFPIAQQLGDELTRLASKVPYPIQASTDRIGGARLLYRMLREGEWAISDACEKLIDCIPQLIHDEPPKAEDVLKVDNGPGQLGDDAYDSARYGLYTHFTPVQKSKEAEVRDQAKKYKDPLEKWAYLRANLPREPDMTPFRQNFKIWWEIDSE